ncbi:hypothetical protein AB1E18_004269 [Capra hircus]
MSTQLMDTLLIIFVFLCLLFSITWVLVYRTDKYKRLRVEMEKWGKKLKRRRKHRQEEKLKNNNRCAVLCLSLFAIGVCFIAQVGMFNSIFDGLPQGSLLEADTIDCSSIFQCILSATKQAGGFLGSRPPSGKFFRNLEEPYNSHSF